MVTGTTNQQHNTPSSYIYRMVPYHFVRLQHLFLCLMYNTNAEVALDGQSPQSRACIHSTTVDIRSSLSVLWQKRRDPILTVTIMNTLILSNIPTGHLKNSHKQNWVDMNRRRIPFPENFSIFFRESRTVDSRAW